MITITVDWNEYLPPIAELGRRASFNTRKNALLKDFIKKCQGKSKVSPVKNDSQSFIFAEEKDAYDFEEWLENLKDSID